MKIKKIVSPIIFVLLFSILIYNFVIIAQTIIIPEKTPSFLGIKTYVTISGSMEPEIKIGDIVIVKEMTEDNLNVGDIISYRNGQNIVTHRITKINNESNKKHYITKGDSNNVEDSNPVTIELIEGKVINTIPNIGNIVLMLRDKVAIIIITVMFFGYLYFANNSKNKKEEQTEELEKEEKTNEELGEEDIEIL